MTPDGDDIATHDDLELALTAALEHRAGGTIDAKAPGGGADRFAAIEAAVGAGHRNRRRLPILAAAAAAVVLVGTLAIVRSADDAEVQSVGGDPATTVSVPGTDPTVTFGPGPDGTAPPTTGPEVTPTPPADLSDTVLANLTYPLSVCPGDAIPPDQVGVDSFTLVDGRASIPFADPAINLSGFGVDLVEIVRGDVTDDGQPDAVIRLECFLTQSDGVRDTVALVSSVDGVPTVLGKIFESGYPSTASATDPETGEVTSWRRFESILSVRVDGGRLFVRWNQRNVSIGDFDEQRELTVEYAWGGPDHADFIPMDAADITTVPARDPAPPTPMIPLDDADFTNVTLPTDPRLSGEGRAVCARTFAGDQPVETKVVDGHGVVRNDQGDELGTVDIDHVELANLLGDELNEALVWIRCTKGTSSVLTVTVFQPVAGPPALIWATPQANYAWDEVAGVETRPGQDCVMRIQYRASDHSVMDSWVDWRWTGFRFEWVAPGGCAT